MSPASTLLTPEPTALYTLIGVTFMGEIFQKFCFDSDECKRVKNMLIIATILLILWLSKPCKLSHCAMMQF